MATRAEQKARTRTALIDSVLRRIGDGANFATISLREVARTAGVVPTSFYRHFGDMDELGLAVVDQLGLDLRRLLRTPPEPRLSRDTQIRRAISGYLDYVEAHADLVRFANQARTGGRSALQATIRGELAYFTTQLSTMLREPLPTLKPAERDTVAATLLAVLIEATTELLALTDDDESGRRELRQGLERRLSVVLLGADQLAAKAKAKPRKSAGRTRTPNSTTR